MQVIFHEQWILEEKKQHNSRFMFAYHFVDFVRERERKKEKQPQTEQSKYTIIPGARVRTWNGKEEDEKVIRILEKRKN